MFLTSWGIASNFNKKEETQQLLFNFLHEDGKTWKSKEFCYHLMVANNANNVKKKC